MPDFSLEDAAGGIVAGIDEAGRGPWAGPVVAAAVILDRHRVPPGLDDSKALSAKKRAALFSPILETARVGVGRAGVEDIERLNILGAALLAMARAMEDLGTQPDLALIDGNRPPRLPCPVQCVVKGDSRSLSVAAASIVAKVTRDRLMAELAQTFPGYGWERNAGYGTREHSAALERLGVTPHHRRSFAPIIKILGQTSG
jgi:ribonuclease HII